MSCDADGALLTEEIHELRAKNARPSATLTAAIIGRYENKYRKQVLRRIRSGEAPEWRWQKRYRFMRPGETLTQFWARG